MKKNNNNELNIKWGDTAADLNIDDMKHYESIVKKADLENENSDSENEVLDKIDLLDNFIKTNKTIDERDNDVDYDDEEMIIGIQL